MCRPACWWGKKHCRYLVQCHHIVNTFYRCRWCSLLKACMPGDICCDELDSKCKMNRWCSSFWNHLICHFVCFFLWRVMGLLEPSSATPGQRQGNTQIHTQSWWRIYIYLSAYKVCFWTVWGENPRMHQMNMQTPQKVSANLYTTTALKQ